VEIGVSESFHIDRTSNGGLEQKSLESFLPRIVIRLSLHHLGCKSSVSPVEFLACFYFGFAVR
jgi:hypothetical protein